MLGEQGGSMLSEVFLLMFFFFFHYVMISQFAKFQTNPNP